MYNFSALSYQPATNMFVGIEGCICLTCAHLITGDAAGKIGTEVCCARQKDSLVRFPAEVSIADCFHTGYSAYDCQNRCPLENLKTANNGFQLSSGLPVTGGGGIDIVDIVTSVIYNSTFIVMVCLRN